VAGAAGRQQSRVDHMSIYRGLSAAACGDAEPTRGLFPDLAAPDGWVQRWRPLGPGADVMDRAHPVHIPRNHVVEEAVAAATAGDLDPLERLLDARAPLDHERLGLALYAAITRKDFSACRTFCGT
jgi:uncharacterized protein YdiU (UPF0061 family)